MDEATAFRRASDGFAQLAGRVRDDQWSAPTPCSEWDVRALVNHVAGEYLWVPELMAGRTVADVGDRLEGDVLGDDPAAIVSGSRRRAVTAIEEPGALDRTVHLSFGDLPALAYARQMAVDSVIHSWDLAQAIGDPAALDPELVDVSYAELQSSAEAWRAAGLLGPATTPADGSTQARLLALAGR